MSRIKTNFRLGRSRTTRVLCQSATILFAIFVVLTIFPVASPEDSATAIIDVDTYSLNLSTDGDINLAIAPTNAGKLSIAKSTISATTTSPTGYQLYIDINSSSNNIYREGDTTHTADQTIVATSGTYNNPVALSVDSTTPASWGYAVPGLNQFDATYNITSPSTTAKFAALTIAPNATRILSHHGAVTNHTTDVYYGIKANLGIASGDYVTTVRYIALSDASSIDGGEATITPNELDEGYSATTATITTSLNTELPLGTITATIGSSNCTNVTVTNTHPATFTCTIPAGLAVGQYNVTVNFTTLGKSYTITDGVEVKTPPHYYSVYYNANGGTKLPATQSCPTADTACTLTLTDFAYGSSNVPTKSGYVFAGYTEDSTNTNEAGAYSPGSLIYLDHDVTLYPIWIAESRLGFGTGTNKVTTMQAMTANVCNSLTTPSAFTSGTTVNTNVPTGLLQDTRDFKVYNVSKLADGKCWMTQNLALDLSSSKTLTPANTNITANWTPARSTIPRDDLRNATDSWQNNGNIPYSFNPADEYFDGTYFTSANCNYLTSSTCPHSSKTQYALNGSHGHMGNYYNWSATVASNDTSTFTTQNQDHPTSICPKGWRLAHGYGSASTSASGNDFQTLTSTYSVYYSSFDEKLLASPLFFTRSGYVYSGSLNLAGGYGYLWSSTVYSDTYARYLGFDSGGVGAGSSNAVRGYGFSVRCVAESVSLAESYANNGKSKITVGGNDYYKMQDMTPQICSDTTENPSELQVVDTRDNKIYWIAKLADGKCWMTQNLDLDLGSPNLAATNPSLPVGTLTPDDTNITENWTPERATINASNNKTTTGANGAITGWANDNYHPYSVDVGNVYSDGTYYTYAICNYLTTDCEHFKNTPQDSAQEHGHVGNYYNWSATVASNDTSSMTTENQDAPNSICPKGWRLTHGSGSASGNDFQTLTSTYSISGSDEKLLASPLFFTRSGGVYSGSLSGAGDDGRLWSSTVYSGTVARCPYFGSGNVNPSGRTNQYYGFSVRCVAL